MHAAIRRLIAFCQPGIRPAIVAGASLMIASVGMGSVSSGQVVTNGTVSPRSAVPRQTTTTGTVVPPNTPFQVEFDNCEPATEPVTYSIIVNSAVAATWTPAQTVRPSAGVCRGPVPGQSAGVKTLSVRATNSIGTSESVPVTVTSGRLPLKPGAPTVIVTVTTASANVEIRQPRQVR